jgi:thymidylate synthase
MSGDNRVETIAPFSKEISKFSDDGERFFGAYGPRIIDQISYVAKTLHYDNDSRQAVISIWRPNPPVSKDIPCTVSLQWIIRDGKLHCFANMRSSDVWLGVPYDWFNFSAISLGLLVMLNNRKDPALCPLVLGNLYFYAASQHLYETEFEKVRFILFECCNYISIRPVDDSDFRTYDSVVEHLRWAADGHTNTTRPSKWLKEVI